MTAKSKACAGRYCMGPKVHAARCRPGRPRCWWQRKASYGPTCDCGAYGYPHRKGSGPCGDPEAMYRMLSRPLRRGQPVAWGSDDEAGEAG